MSFLSSRWWLTSLILFFCYLPFSSIIDLEVARFFSIKNTFRAPQWTWLVYTYGILPGQLLFVASSLSFLVLLIRGVRSSLFFSSLYISLVLAVGGGLISHGVFKQFWQRPRPKQTTLFGGKYPYCPVWKNYRGKKDRHLRSLPSGHATMGFYFFSLYFVGKRLKKRHLMAFGVAAAWILGGILCFARFSQGGHFLSDSILSLFIMWQTCYWLDQALEKYLESRKTNT